ncbi:hypothetical protein KYI92_16645 [Pantoea allii]|uniref:Uncharacterized protein n=1 Tax=Pantoea allii TaxID=574096 RepID=A0ABS6VLB5_9GAMM|nr:MULTISPECIES: hypothetical protein [Pantoea]MBW1215370.1 hypothetical protein [Pantoea allii]MBW1260110.1 hypothetical protein [Pantoea allii]MBW1267995.1 hypothetical protein [Pantoea allii]MBW1290002.1 hypothetical protein [Pantoea allii]
MTQIVKNLTGSTYASFKNGLTDLSQGTFLLRRFAGSPPATENCTGNRQSAIGNRSGIMPTAKRENVTFRRKKTGRTDSAG